MDQDQTGQILDSVDGEVSDACADCGNGVDAHVRSCAVCGADCGFPNVRHARRSEELSALEKRWNDALVSCRARGCEDVLREFRLSVEGSFALIARPLSEVQTLFMDDRQQYVSFQKKVAQGSAVPRDNEFDQTRSQYEAGLFPYYYSDMLFGSLSLDAKGMSGYGNTTLVLSEASISKRASVFEENPYSFAKKHKVLINDPFPVGYRADWHNRAKLAAAKLHSQLDPTTNVEEFSSILALDDGTTGGADFVEVHVFGPIVRRSVSQIVTKMPKSKVDKCIVDALEESAAEIDVKVTRV